jgi:ABC-type sugar transport system permease subunit
MTVTGYALSEPSAGAMQRGAVTRMLEDERWLALVLLLPTLALLSLFIAYPFVKGVELSVTDAKVGVAGSFVGLHNFAVLANDSDVDNTLASLTVSLETAPSHARLGTQRVAQSRLGFLFQRVSVQHRDGLSGVG